MIAQIQYVSSPLGEKGHTAAIEQALELGIRWIQLRMKGMSESEMKELAIQSMKLCRKYEAVFLINDHVDLVKELDADGVHLGKEDMDAIEARKILGPDKIIGATANTIEDIVSLAEKPIHYLGVGPFRYTATKQKLSPILGADGYARILEQMREQGITIPVIAIGGIESKDAQILKETGVYGVAVSGAINKSENPVDTTQQFKAFFDDVNNRR